MKQPTTPKEPAKQPAKPVKNPIVDKKPLPGGGEQVKRKDGSVKETRPAKGGGTVVEVKRPNGGSTKTVSNSKGDKTQTIVRVNPKTGKTSVTEVKVGKDGSRETKHANGARSERKADGSKVVVSPKGNVKVVVSAPQPGKNGRSTITKTVIINNKTVVINNNYRTVHRGGHSYYSYSPFYHPFLYTPIWSPFYYNPWVTPYYYGWSWYPRHYRSWYYTPYPYYTSSYFWLTDYVIRDAIYTSYQRNEASNSDSDESSESNNQAAISEEVKKQVAVQVEQAMKDLEAKKEPAIESAMNTEYIFMVNDAADVNVVDEEGEEGEACALDSGDLVKLAELPADGAEKATMEVVSSKGGCEAKANVSMDMESVQGMFNDFNERLEKGVAKMKEEKEAGTLKINQ